ncbi:hypothetical protein [Flavobacterium restrictum]|nr:hypothetical protein [Flavobacterium restrictum]
MKTIFKIEKVLHHSENMELVYIEIRIKILGQNVLSYRLQQKTKLSLWA